LPNADPEEAFVTRKSKLPPPSSPPSSVGRAAAAAAVRERPGGPTQDELLDEALKETFPASDPTSVYQVERSH
jgi:hypothetical protein